MKSFKLLMFAAATLFAVPAAAAPTITTKAYGISADLRVGGSAVGAVAATPIATGTAPGAFNRVASVASVNERLTLVDTAVLDVVQTLRSGVVTSTASSTFPATMAGTANALIADASLGLQTEVLGGLGGLTRSLGLGLDAELLNSTTSIGLDAAGRLAANHASSITGLKLSGALSGLVTLDALAKAAAAPNGFVDLGAVKLFLNERGEQSTGTGGLFAFTNAVRIQLSDYALGGRLVSGQVILGRSEASVNGFEAAVPEPATWVAMILGFGAVGGTLRRRGGRPALA